MDLIYNIRITDSATEGLIRGVFHFDGRLRSGQQARFSLVNEKPNFRVMVSKKTGPVWREMKDCDQKDIILAQLKRNVLRMVGENKTVDLMRTVSDNKGERELEKADEALALKISDEDDAQEKLAVKSKVTSHRKREKMLQDAHNRTNQLIAKAIDRSPALAKAAKVSKPVQVSDAPLEIPDFLKRA